MISINNISKTFNKAQATAVKALSNVSININKQDYLIIVGSNGSGKSTLLIAIQFALYGTGKKLQSYGKSSCSVELTIEDIHIIRTKTPNRLILNDDYEDEIAQNIINKKLSYNLIKFNYDLVLLPNLIK